MSKFQQFVIGAILFIIGSNMVGLWVVQSIRLRQAHTQQVTPGSNSDFQAFEAEMARLNTKLQQHETLLASLSATVPGGTQAEPGRTQPVQQSTVTGPTSLFLGSGQTTHREWQTIPGASVTLNPSEYHRRSLYYFEASLRILGGEAKARLFDTTSNKILYETELMNNTSQATWKLSPSFSLPAGTRTLVVQMQSSSGEVATLEGARLTIR